MEFIVKVLLYDSDSKFFYSFTFYFLELLFTFSSQNYFLLILLRTTFYFLLYLLPMSYS